MSVGRFLWWPPRPGDPGVLACALLVLTSCSAHRPTPVTAAPAPVSRPAAPTTVASPPRGSGGEAPACPLFDPVDTRKHLRNTLEPLMAGDETTARNELRLALCQEPDDETAKSLLWQLDAVPEEAFGREFVCYTVREGDSLPRLAKEFLGDPYKFYLLAKYNGLEQPGRLRAGQCLKIPGPPPSGPPNTAAPLVRCGEEELAAGDPRRAYGFFLEASRIDPTLAQTQERVRETRPAVLEAYHKEAVAALRRQRFGQAIGTCRKALEINAQDAKARALLQEAEDLQFRLVSLFFDEAVLALGKGDRAEALADCDKVLELDPTHAKAKELRVTALGR